jgi:putative aminopeptidase FrvX
MSARLPSDAVDAAVDTVAQFLVALLNTPSPTGYTDDAIALCREASEALGWPGLRASITRKGALLLTLPGAAEDAPRGITAHIDTLGAMVKEIRPSGRLKLTMIGGSPWTAVEYEGVTVRASDGSLVRGSIVPVNGSTHVNRDAATMPRNENTLEVRLDALTRSAADTRALGIAPGDFVFFDPRVELSEAGFIRSRHLDDKLCAAAVLAALHALRNAGLAGPLPQTTHILFSNYEEVGHGGGDGWPAALDEYLCVDMAAMGDGQASDEFSVTLCVKDSSGPYSFALNEKLRRLAVEHEIALTTDVYPYYGSDGSAYWRSGGAARVALIGPGVDSSHGYERGHRDGLRATAHLIAAYLLAE